MSADIQRLILSMLLAIGSTVATAQIARTSNQNPRVQVYEFEDGRMQTEVLSTSALKTTDMAADQGVAISKALRLPAVNKWSHRELLLVSAGYATNLSDRPDGLLVSNGNAASLPSRAELPAAPDDPCPLRHKARLKLSGLFCVKADGKTQVSRYSDEAAADCFQARQSGPLLVEDGHAAVCPRLANERPTHRTVVCVNGNRVKFIVTESPVDLFELSQWLAGDPAAPRCTWALNLSDSNSSGSLYTERKAYKPNKPVHFTGTGTNPVAAFIAVRQR